MSASFFAMGSSLGWGISNFLGGLRSRERSMWLVLLVSQLTSFALLVCGICVLSPHLPNATSIGFAVLAGLGELVGVAALYRGLSVGTMGVVSPLSATASVLPLLVSLATGNLPSAVGLAGLGLVAVGVLMTTIEKSENQRAATNVSASVVFGLLSAVGFGGYYVTMQSASEMSVPWALLISRSTTVVVILAINLLVKTQLNVTRQELPGLMLIGLLIVMADALYATASTHGNLAVAATLGETHPVVTIAFARIFMHEQVSRLRWLGVAMTIMGITIVSCG